jgi:hypothetical protein
MFIRKTLPVVVASLALPLLGAGAASAATVGYSNGTLSYTAATGEANHLVISSSGNEIFLSDVVPVTPQSGCSNTGADGAVCLVPAAPTLVARLGDLNDSVIVRDGTSITSALLDGGPGNDYLQGGHEPDTFLGGTGFDHVSYASRTEHISVSLGQPGNPFLSNGPDGATGENDTVATDVEQVDGGSGGNTLTASCCANATSDVLNGGAGPDFLVSSGMDSLGRGATDFLNGYSGDDTIYANDGIHDVISCGPGNDYVQADLKDTFTPSSADCETLDIAPRGELPTVAVAHTARALPRHRLRVHVACPAKHAGTCHGVLTVSAVRARRNVRLGSAAFAIRRGAARNVVVSLTRAARGRTLLEAVEHDANGRPKTSVRRITI